MVAGFLLKIKIGEQPPNNNNSLRWYLLLVMCSPIPSPANPNKEALSSKPPLLSTIINNIVQKKDDGSMRITGKVHW
jgi:hypothetical protein